MVDKGCKQGFVQISHLPSLLPKSNKQLPCLLNYYKTNYKLVDTSDDITKAYNNENNLTEEQNDMLRKEVF